MLHTVQAITCIRFVDWQLHVPHNLNVWLLFLSVSSICEKVLHLGLLHTLLPCDL